MTAPPPRRSRGRALRVVGEVALLIVGLAILLGVARGLTPIAPVLGTVLRFALNPLTLLLGGLLFILLRMGVIRARRRAER